MCTSISFVIYQHEKVVYIYAYQDNNVTFHVRDCSSNTYCPSIDYEEIEANSSKYCRNSVYHILILVLSRPHLILFQQHLFR
jgi:hypothetical protein